MCVVKVWPQSTGDELQRVNAPLGGRGPLVNLTSLQSSGEGAVAFVQQVADVGHLLDAEAGQLRAAIRPPIGLVDVRVLRIGGPGRPHAVSHKDEDRLEAVGVDALVGAAAAPTAGDTGCGTGDQRLLTLGNIEGGGYQQQQYYDHYLMEHCAIDSLASLR